MPPSDDLLDVASSKAKAKPAPAVVTKAVAKPIAKPLATPAKPVAKAVTPAKPTVAPAKPVAKAVAPAKPVTKAVTPAKPAVAPAKPVAKPAPAVAKAKAKGETETVKKPAGYWTMPENAEEIRVKIMTFLRRRPGKWFTFVDLGKEIGHSTNETNWSSEALAKKGQVLRQKGEKNRLMISLAPKTAAV